MDTSPIFLPVLILHLLCICVASAGQFDGSQDLVLSRSVFNTYRRTTLEVCRRLCMYSSRCLSVNWSPSTRECQLNSKKGDVESLQVSKSNIYLTVKLNTALQGHACANQPCSIDHMCIPVNTAKAHACVRIDASLPQTTDERMPSKTAITTFTAATTSAAPPTTLEVTTPMSTSMRAMTTLEPTPSATTVSTATTTYNSTCVTDVDCAVPPGRTCFDGVCICSIGYDLDETSVKCRKVTECTSFSSEFTLHVDMAITGHNFAKNHSKTAAECEQLCLHSNTVCKSFETYSNTCFLQNVTWFDVDVADQRVDERVDYYQRKCNW